MGEIRNEVRSRDRSGKIAVNGRIILKWVPEQ
jgi:hypothetical protein